MFVYVFVKVSASTISMAYPAKLSNSLITSNLSLNTGNRGVAATHKSSGSGIFSSLKATTLNASKIFNKATALSRSSSPQTPTTPHATPVSTFFHSSKKPIDLEAHIITGDLGFKKIFSVSNLSVYG